MMYSGNNTYLSPGVNQHFNQVDGTVICCRRQSVPVSLRMLVVVANFVNDLLISGGLWTSMTRLEQVLDGGLLLVVSRLVQGAVKGFPGNRAIGVFPNPI
jgi:hypothetical protein